MQIRILVVDDEADFAATLAANLEYSDYDVKTAADAHAAITTLSDFRPHIALIDIRLGQDDGFELLEQLHATDPDLVCVMITAFSDNSYAIRAIKNGAYDFLRKPFQHNELLSVVDRCVEKIHLSWEKAAAIKALQQSEEHFRLLFHTAPDSMVLVRANDLVITDVNHSGLSVYGFRRDEIVGNSLFDIEVWADPKQREDVLTTLETYGLIKGQEVEAVLRDGQRLPVLLSGTAIVFDDGLHYLLTARDISEQKRAVAALMQSENDLRTLSRQLRTLLDGITDALMLLSLDGTVVWANCDAARFFDVQLDSLQGADARLLWRAETAACQAALQAVIETAQPLERDWKTASDRYWSQRLFPICNHDGTVEQVIQVIRDQTDAAQLREEAARQSHLAALGELSAGVAHEINNPTGTIMRSITLLKDAFADALPVLDERYREHGDFSLGGIPYSEMRDQVAILTNDIQDGAKRIKRIVDDLKDFSRPPIGSGEGRIDLGAAVEHAVRLMQNHIKRVTDRFQLDVDAALPDCTGQNQRIEQVVINLLQNACQAVSNRDEVIRVTVRFDRNRRMNILIVEDEGCGIESADREKILQPFFTSRRSEGGTGLGLSVSARIVNDLGGELTFDSEPGRGSIFRVALPVADGGEV